MRAAQQFTVRDLLWLTLVVALVLAGLVQSNARRRAEEQADIIREGYNAVIGSSGAS